MCSSDLYPPQRYATNSFSYTNGGLVAFGYLSVIGDGKNYQLNTSSNKYYFVINSTQAITFFNRRDHPPTAFGTYQLSGVESPPTLLVRWPNELGTTFTGVMEGGAFRLDPPPRPSILFPGDYTHLPVRRLNSFPET